MTGVVFVAVKPDYMIGIEDVDGLIFCHATVMRWSGRVAAAFRHDLDDVCAAYGPPVFACAVEPHAGDHRKLDRFVTRMGFRYHSVIGSGDLTRVAYVRWN